MSTVYQIWFRGELHWVCTDRERKLINGVVAEHARAEQRFKNREHGLLIYGDFYDAAALLIRQLAEPSEPTPVVGPPEEPPHD